MWSENIRWLIAIAVTELVWLFWGKPILQVCAWVFVRLFGVKLAKELLTVFTTSALLVMLISPILVILLLALVASDSNSFSVEGGVSGAVALIVSLGAARFAARTIAGFLPIEGWNSKFADRVRRSLAYMEPDPGPDRR